VPDTTLAEMRKLRAWRTWLLIGVAFVQGAQYVLHPELPYRSDSYDSLRTMGTHGWMGLGAALIIVASYLALASPRNRWIGHVAGAVLYLTLVFAAFLSGVVPAVLALPALLHLGEVRLWAWHRRRDR
jgi:hypothetical protein